MILTLLVLVLFGLAPAWADDSITSAFFADVNGTLVPLSGETFEKFNKKLKVFSYSEKPPAPAEFFLEMDHYAGTSYELRRRFAGFVRGYFTFGYALRNTKLEFDANQKLLNYPFYSCMDPHEHVNAIRYDVDPHEDCVPVDIYLYHYNRKTGAAVKHYVPEVKKGCEPTPGVVLPWRCYAYHPEPRPNDPDPEEEDHFVGLPITSKSVYSTKLTSFPSPSSSESATRIGSLFSSSPSLAPMSDKNTFKWDTEIPTSTEMETGSHQSTLPQPVLPEFNSSTEPESVQAYSIHTDSAVPLSLIVPQNSTAQANSQDPVAVRSRPEAHAPSMSAEPIWLQNVFLAENNSKKFAQVGDRIGSPSCGPLTSNVSALSAASWNPDGYSDPSGPQLSSSSCFGSPASSVFKYTASDQPTMTSGATCYSSVWISKGTTSPVLRCSVATNPLDKENESSAKINYLEKGTNSVELDATTTLTTALNGVQCVGCEARSVVYLWNTYTDYTTSCSQGTTLTITRCDSSCSPFTMTVTRATVLTVTGVCIVPETTEVAIADGFVKSIHHEVDVITSAAPSMNSPGQVPRPSTSPSTPSQGGDNTPNMVYTTPASTPGAFGQTTDNGSDTKPKPTGQESITPITNAAAKSGNAVWLLVLAACL